MIKSRILTAIVIVGLSIVPASYAAAGGSNFSIGISVGGYGGHGGHYGGYGHSRGRHSYGSHRSYRSHNYGSSHRGYGYSRGHRSYGSRHKYRSHNNYRAPHYGYRYRTEDRHGRRSYGYYSRPGHRSYGHSRPHRDRYQHSRPYRRSYQYSRPHNRNYGHGERRGYSSGRRYRSSGYGGGYNSYSYAPVGYGSSSYCPTYGSSYNYGSGSYRNYGYRKYSGVNTYYGRGYRGSYPAPIVVNPITPDRSYTYDQSKSSIEDYRQWQRDGEQSPAGRDFENDEPGRPISARDRAQMVEAWELIGADEPRKALNQFAGLCEANPNSPDMKAGYAVSAALSGDDRSAYWAMRRAVKAGRGMVGYLPAADGLDSSLSELVGAIQGQIEAQGASADRMFLLAGVQMLQHDNAAALVSAEEAYRLGDRHETTSQMLGHLRSQSAAAQEPAVAVK